MDDGDQKFRMANTRGEVMVADKKTVATVSWSRRSGGNMEFVEQIKRGVSLM